MNNKVYKKATKTLDAWIKKELEIEFEKREEEIKEIIMDEYNMELSSAVTDRRSRTNPGLSKYVDAFQESLEDLELFKIKDAGVVLEMPDTETYKFSTGTLKVIQQILEGTAGVYAEIDAEQYEKMFGRPPRNLQAFDEQARKKDMVYIIRYTADVRRRERESLEANQRLVRYPFSNTPPIDIFDNAKRYVDDNIKRWIDASLKRALKRFQRDYRG